VTVEFRRKCLLRIAGGAWLIFVALIVPTWFNGSGSNQLPYGVAEMFVLTVTGCLIWALDDRMREVAERRPESSAMSDAALDALADRLASRLVRRHRAHAIGHNPQGGRTLAEGFTEYLAARDDMRREQGEGT
jgi:hypothetical protein